MKRMTGRVRVRVSLSKLQIKTSVFCGTTVPLAFFCQHVLQTRHFRQNWPLLVRLNIAPLSHSHKATLTHLYANRVVDSFVY